MKLEKVVPCLEFADRQFDLCVCSHLLFLYSEQSDENSFETENN
jgi:hypothetical protein